MHHIHIITLGKLKEHYWLSAEAEYLKRLQPFAKITIHELKEESFTEKDPIELIKQKEAKKILAELDKIKDGYVVALEEKGKLYSSPDFSTRLMHWNEITGSLVLIIGGPLGLDRAVILKAQTTLSLSPLTFTHQMTRVILLEQIYRAYMINQGRKYHY